MILLIPLLITYFYLFEKVERLSIVNSNAYQLIGFSDENKGGGSSVDGLEKREDGIHFQFQIGNDEVNYAGFNMVLNDSLKDLIHLYNQIEVVFQTQNVNALSITSKTWEAGITDESDENTYRINSFLVNNIEVGKRTKVTFGFDDFKTRDWWISQYAPDSQLNKEPNWEETIHFSLLEESEIDINQPSSIILEGLMLKKDHSLFFIISGILVMIVFVLTFILSPKKLKKKEEVVVTYKSVEVDEKPSTNWEEEVLNYIGREYPNPELKLLHLSKHFIKSERVISAVIHEELNLTFKQYLNNIRIKEAKKLLKDTDLSIKEITYAVGYNSPNNFRRVFKQVEGISPSEFKED